MATVAGVAVINDGMESITLLDCAVVRPTGFTDSSILATLLTLSQRSPIHESLLNHSLKENNSKSSLGSSEGSEIGVRSP